MKMTVARTVRWLLLIVGAIGIAAISVFATQLHNDFKPQFKPIALTTRLGKTWAQASADFDGRIKSRFPIGSSVLDMGTELRHDYFVRTDWTTSLAEEHGARREENDMVCHRGVYVFWRADAANKITAIRGEYREEGCI
jgi:hypothetical protein